MNLLNKLKAGAKVAPALLIVLYFIFVVLDILSTYLASPDLRYEGNWAVLLFKLNWYHFIGLYTFVAIFVTLGLLFGLNYLNNYYKSNTLIGRALVSELLSNKKLLSSYIFLGCFYSHIINIAHILINNYLAYIYLYKNGHIFRSISTSYILNQDIFHLYIQIVPLIIGYLIAFYKIKKIKNVQGSIPTQ